jgi:serine/threonine protein kinase
MEMEIFSVDILADGNDKLSLDYSHWNANCIQNNNKVSLESRMFFLTEDMCEYLKNEELLTRIGSESVNAQVFKFSPANTGNVFALKVIPYSGHEKKNVIREIEYSEQLGNAETSLDWACYPALYKSCRCDEILIKAGSNLHKKYRRLEIPGYFIVYELLAYDLIQLIESTIALPPRKIASIISDVLRVIEDLNYKQNISHNDLHCGNVMFRCGENGISFKPVVIDFGTAKEYQDSDVFVQKYGDVVAFFNSLYSRTGKVDKKTPDGKNLIFAIDNINNMLLEADYLKLENYITSINDFIQIFEHMFKTGNFPDKLLEVKSKLG